MSTRTIRPLLIAAGCAFTLLVSGIVATAAETPPKPAQTGCASAHAGGMQAQGGRHGAAGHEGRMGRGMDHGAMHASADHAAMHAAMHGEAGEHRHDGAAPAAPPAAPAKR
jgi:hypothetical protein